MPVLGEEVLLDFARRLLEAGGLSTSEADVIAKSLIQSNLRGYDSHGVMRIPYYLDAIKEGKVKVGETLRIEHETVAVLTCDGGWGLGQVLSRDLVARLIEKARVSGVACGTLRRSAHIGRLGEYAEMAAEQNMASLVCANMHGAAQRVAPIGGKRPRLGTNPLCIGMPGGAEGPFVLDFSTSATAEGKVRVKRIASEPVPPGWLLDPDGRPTTDPNQLYGDPPGSILPTGGDQAYKGFGLAFMIELLCGGFSGGQTAYPNAPPPVGNCAFFAVFDPRLFSGTAHLLREVSHLEQYVRDVPLIDGVTQVSLPGDPERRTLSERRVNGIPLDDGNWSALQKLAHELGVESP